MVTTKQENIRDGLMKIRIFRRVCHYPIIAFIVLAVVMQVLPDSIKELIKPVFNLFFGLAFISFFLGFFVRQLTCPNCNLKFHYKKLGIGYRYNDFTSKCMNCGLKLNNKSPSSNPSFKRDA